MTDPVLARQYHAMGYAGRNSVQPDDGGPPADVAIVYERELTYVWQSLRRLGIPPSDLEDAVHDTFIVVHRRLADYDPARPLRPWLFGIAFRIACRHRRRDRRDLSIDTVSPPVDQALQPDQALDDRRARAALMQALEALDIDQRAVFVMHDIDGCSAPEIAGVLAIPLNTVYSRLRLARAKLVAATAGARGGGGEGAP